MKYSLYTDGSHYHKLKKAGIGGYLLDENGNQIWEFSKQIVDNKDREKHETHALTHGLRRCITSEVKNLQCFTDDINLVNILNIQDKQKRNNHIGSNPYLKDIINLLKKFDEITFVHLPRSKNKKADELASKEILKNAPPKNKIADGSFQLPNLFSIASLKNDKDKFSNLKKEIKTHYIFDLCEQDNSLKVYEINKNFWKGEQSKIELKIISSKDYKLDNNWTKHHINIVNEILKNTNENEVGLLFYPSNNRINKLLKGLEPITKKTKISLEELKEIASKFTKIVVHDDKNIIDAVISSKIIPIEEEPEIIKLRKCEEVITDNLSILSSPEYQLGSNPRLEKFFSLSKEKLGDIKEIQKKYLGELIKLNIKIENKSQKDNPNTHKEKVIDRVKEMREKLESKGIKLNI